MIFSGYFVKLVFVFSCKYDITLLSKNQIRSSPEKYSVGFPVNHPRKYGISSDRKIKDDKKVYLVKYAWEELIWSMKIILGIIL